jgi:uncharacterized protein YbjT (DUF2867 family)
LRLFVFGLGYVGEAFALALRGRGWDIAASARSPEQAASCAPSGITPADPDDKDAMAAALTGVNAVLITSPPGPDGCVALESVIPALAQAQAFPDWIGYLSTTGVYGDFEGRWVFETSPLKAQSVEGARRVGAERDWRQVGRGMGLTVTTFRLPGIYGPGRSALDRLRAGEGRRIVKPGQVFSRIHLDDIVSGLLASLDRPRAGGIYNLCRRRAGPAAGRHGIRRRPAGRPGAAGPAVQHAGHVARHAPLLRREQARLEREGQGGVGLAVEVSDLSRGAGGDLGGGRLDPGPARGKWPRGPEGATRRASL